MGKAVSRRPGASWEKQMWAVQRLLKRHRRWQVKTQHHNNPDDPQGLPDVELFWHGGSTDLVTGDGPAKRG
jgi:hypothetical protein